MATKTTKPRKAIAAKVTKQDLGIALHTALRKGCDSSPTSAAWNMINYMDPYMWGLYLELLLEELRKIEKPSIGDLRDLTCDLWDPFGEIDKQWRDDNTLLPAEVHRNRKDRTLITVMGCIFDSFEENDWFGYACFLKEIGVKLRDSQKHDAKKAATILDERLRKRWGDELISVGVGEARTEQLYIYATKAVNKHWLDRLKYSGYMGYKVEIVVTGRPKPA